jgi:acyl-CoA thioester hydrolase
MNELLRDYPVTIEITVAWGEMDAFQHVNNKVYFKYFESVRIAYLERIESLEVMEKTGIGPILASTQCRFKIPLTYPDTVTVGARVEAMGEDRFSMKYAVLSHKFEKIAAEGEGVLVFYDYRNNRKAAILDEIRSRIIELEKGVSNDL